jgi:hypothetical protein
MNAPLVGMHQVWQIDLWFDSKFAVQDAENKFFSARLTGSYVKARGFVEQRKRFTALTERELWRVELSTKRLGEQFAFFHVQVSF